MLGTVSIAAGFIEYHHIPSQMNVAYVLSKIRGYNDGRYYRQCCSGRQEIPPIFWKKTTTAQTNNTE
jgi:hypothetical protein